MANPYKDIHQENGHLQFSKINQNGRQLIQIQNLPESHTDSGLHYSIGSICVDLPEAMTLIGMLADELGLDITVTKKAD